MNRATESGLHIRYKPRTLSRIDISLQRVGDVARGFPGDGHAVPGTAAPAIPALNRRFAAFRWDGMVLRNP